MKSHFYRILKAKLKVKQIQWGFYIDTLTSYESIKIMLLFFLLALSPTSALLSAGWPPSPQASAQVTYKSSSKPRARFLSGPVSLSICLYLSPFHHFPYHILGAPANFLPLCSSLLSIIYQYSCFIFN